MSNKQKALFAGIASILISKSWNQRLTDTQKAENEIAEQAKTAIPHPIVNVPFSQELELSQDDATSLLQKFLQSEVVRYKNVDGIEESILNNTFDMELFKANILEFKYPSKLTGEATKTFHADLDKAGMNSEGERSAKFAKPMDYIKTKFPEVSVDAIAETLSAWKGLVSQGGDIGEAASKRLITLEEKLIPLIKGELNDTALKDLVGLNRADVANIFELDLKKSVAKVEEEDLDFDF